MDHDSFLFKQETLKAYFELFGELADAVVMMKEGRSRGFGFVTFAFPQGIDYIHAQLSLMHTDVPPNFVTSMHVVDGKQVGTFCCALHNPWLQVDVKIAPQAVNRAVESRGCTC